jgi:hypothetical protein
MESRDTWVVIVGTIVLALGVYVGSYFLAVRPRAAIWFTPTGRGVLTLPDYRGLPPRLFAPMHYFDRTYIRPNLWGSVRVWAVQGRDGLLFNRGKLTNLTSNVSTSGGGWSNAPR